MITGFIPRTLCGDGDPIDVIVLSSYPLRPGVHVCVYVSVYVCLCLYVCVYECMCMRVCARARAHTHTHTHKRAKGRHSQTPCMRARMHVCV